MKIFIGIVALIFINMLFALFGYIAPNIPPKMYTPYQQWVSALIILWIILNPTSGFNV